METLESLSAWLATVPDWAQMCALLTCPTVLMAWILHVGTRPEQVTERVEVPVEVVPPTLARLAEHMNWSPEDDANEGVSIGSRIASHYAELVAERDGARSAADAWERSWRLEAEACLDALERLDSLHHDLDAAEDDRRRHMTALNHEWARQNRELRGERDAWRERCLRHERTHDYASNAWALN